MKSGISIERKEAYAEVTKILSCMDQKYVKKIPHKLKEFFKKNALQDYNFNVSMNKPLSEQNLKRKTLVILAMLNINYWCESEEHKQELLHKYNENEIIYQEELREKYNSDNIFKNKKTKEEKLEKTVAMEEYRESIFTKIKNWFKRVF